ncbi:hypothetical protein M569_08202, partial [Genlisea aurea]
SSAESVTTGTETSGSPLIVPQKSTNLKAFTYAELKLATRNFSTAAKLGEGGFGSVYRGIINSPDDPSKKVIVAVKQLNNRGFQGHKEWATEVNLLAMVEHPNLVKLVGYCAEDDERGIQRLLVYEYMSNRCVMSHLSPTSAGVLSWETRLKIALDAAVGLAHLHEEMSFQIVFRDFKSANILLDDQWNAKLSDFGLARLWPADGRTHISTDRVGTMGYAAPEYVRSGRLRPTSDTWSYGVFLYELITGRLPLDFRRPRNEQNLLEWIKPYLSDVDSFERVIDPRLPRRKVLKSAYKLSRVAGRCLSKRPKARPEMSRVREMVRKLVD